MSATRSSRHAPNHTFHAAGPRPARARRTVPPQHRIGDSTMTADSRSVATSFFKAWTTGDFDTARSLLHDDVSFQGPIDSFTDADSYVAALRGLSQIVQEAQEQKVFTDGKRRVRHLRPGDGD